MNVKIKKLHPAARLPDYKSKGAAGADIYALITEGDMIVLKPMETKKIRTGIAMAVPEGYEVQIRTRSGLADQLGVIVLNAPGTVDSDYRGEVQVLLANLHDKFVQILPGDRIAQMVLQKVERLDWKEVSELEPTERGAGGFGSSGR